MRDYEEGKWRKSGRIIVGSVLVLLALAITGLKEHAAAADSDTQANEDRVQRTIEHRDEVIEQLQLSDKPEIMVSLSYKKEAAKPMPVMLGWFGQRDRKIAELTEHLPATQGMIITEELPPMQPVMAELVDRGCALVSFQNSKPEPRPRRHPKKK